MHGAQPELHTPYCRCSAPSGGASTGSTYQLWQARRSSSCGRSVPAQPRPVLLPRHHSFPILPLSRRLPLSASGVRMAQVICLAARHSMPLSRAGETANAVPRAVGPVPKGGRWLMLPSSTCLWSAEEKCVGRRGNSRSPRIGPYIYIYRKVDHRELRSESRAVALFGWITIRITIEIHSASGTTCHVHVHVHVHAHAHAHVHAHAHAHVM